MDSRGHTAAVALMAGLIVLLLYPAITAAYMACKLWLVGYPRHLLRVSLRKSSRAAWLHSTAISIGGFLETARREWLLARDQRRYGPRLDSPDHVELTSMNTVPSGDLVILLYGTWASQGSLLSGPFAEFANWIARFYTHRRVVVAHWYATNSHSARCRAAMELARQIQACLTPTDKVYLVGHSHGGSVAAIAAALLPAHQIGGVVSLATPFLISNVHARREASMGAAAMELVLRVALALAALYFVFAHGSLHTPTGITVTLLAAMTVFVLLRGSLAIFRVSNGNWPVYYGGPNFTALAVKEDKLQMLMRSVTRMQKSYIAVFFLMERGYRRVDQNHFLRKVLVSSLVQVFALVSAIAYAYANLPAFSRDGYAMGILLGTALFVAGLSTHLCPNPLFYLIGHFCMQVVGGLVRIIPAALMRVVFGVPAGMSQLELVDVSDGRRLASQFRPISIGQMKWVHTTMLSHPRVRRIIVSAIK